MVIACDAANAHPMAAVSTRGQPSRHSLRVGWPCASVTLARPAPRSPRAQSADKARCPGTPSSAPHRARNTSAAGTCQTRRQGRINHHNMLNLGTRTGWLGRQDSNLRMAASKAAALPLGDAPTAGESALYNGLMRVGKLADHRITPNIRAASPSHSCRRSGRAGCRPGDPSASRSPGRVRPRRW
jgi:hypothetical protein